MIHSKIISVKKLDKLNESIHKKPLIVPIDKSYNPRAQPKPRADNKIHDHRNYSICYKFHVPKYIYE